MNRRRNVIEATAAHGVVDLVLYLLVAAIVAICFVPMPARGQVASADADRDAGVKAIDGLYRAAKDADARATTQATAATTATTRAVSAEQLAASYQQQLAAALGRVAALEAATRPAAYNVQPGNGTVQAAINKGVKTLSLAPGTYTGAVLFPSGATGITIDGYGKAVFDGEDKVGPNFIDARGVDKKGVKNCAFNGFTVTRVLSDNRPYQAAFVLYGDGNTVTDVVGTKNHGYCFGFNATNFTGTRIVARDTYGSGLGGQLDDSTLIDCGNIRTNQGSTYWATARPASFKVIAGKAYASPGYEMNKFTSSNRVLFRNFTVDGGNGCGLWFDEPNSGITIDGGTFKNTSGTIFGDVYAGRALMFEIMRGGFVVKGGAKFNNNTGAGLLIGNCDGGLIDGIVLDGDELTLRAETTRYSPSQPVDEANRIWLANIAIKNVTKVNGGSVKWSIDTRFSLSADAYAAKYAITGY
jgi:hypothetical protein